MRLEPWPGFLLELGLSTASKWVSHTMPNAYLSRLDVDSSSHSQCTRATLAIEQVGATLDQFYSISPTPPRPSFRGTCPMVSLWACSACSH